MANYFGGSVAVLPILADGRLGDATDVKADAGKVGPTKATNAPPGSFAFSGHDRTHAHMIQADPSGRFVLHVDLGLDKIFVWKFDEKKGTLTAERPARRRRCRPATGRGTSTSTPTASGSTRSRRKARPSCCSTTTPTTGRLTARQTISTLPPGFAGSNFCSEILVSADGKFVYAGNRLHDSIGIFSVGPDGDADVRRRGVDARELPAELQPSTRPAEFLYCCNQRADNVTVFRVDRKTGGLAFTGHYAPVGNPSCIVFLDLAKAVEPLARWVVPPRRQPPTGPTEPPHDSHAPPIGRGRGARGPVARGLVLGRPLARCRADQAVHRRHRGGGPEGQQRRRGRLGRLRQRRLGGPVRRRRGLAQRGGQTLHDGGRLAGPAIWGDFDNDGFLDLFCWDRQSFTATSRAANSRR